MTAGGYGNDWSSNGTNWAILILPFVEQQNLYNQIMAGTINPYTTQVNVKPYLCPSDPYGNTVSTYGGANAARGSYAANCGPNLGGGQSQVANGGGTYSGAGVFRIGATNGLSMAQITGQDGTANTILFGEVRAGTVTSDVRGTWALSQMGASFLGGCPTGDCWGPNDNNGGSDDVRGCTAVTSQQMGCWNGGNGQATLRSGHRVGANTVFVDGSVHFITNAIDLTTYFWLLSVNDGMSPSNY